MPGCQRFQSKEVVYFYVFDLADRIMAKGKIKTMVIKMLSTAGTGFFYITTKNPRNVLRKLSLRKVSHCLSLFDGG